MLARNEDRHEQQNSLAALWAWGGGGKLGEFKSFPLAVVPFVHEQRHRNQDIGFGKKTLTS